MTNDIAERLREAAEEWRGILDGMKRMGMESDAIEIVDDYFHDMLEIERLRALSETGGEKLRAGREETVRNILNKWSVLGCSEREQIAEEIVAALCARVTPPPPSPSESPVVEGEESFQARVRPWMLACFGEEISGDKLERCDRFMEEAIELVQALGYDRQRVAALIDYVYGRHAGEPYQEVGGVMVTLAALCLANDLDMHTAGETELARIWTKVDAIRAKQAAKPTGSALPIALSAQPPQVDQEEVERLREYHAAVEQLVCVWAGTDQPSSMDEEAWECPGDDGERWLKFIEARAALASRSPLPVKEDSHG